MLPTNASRRSNFPTRPERGIVTNRIPEDILSTGRNLYTQIQFVSYEFGLQTFGPGPVTDAFNTLVNSVNLVTSPIGLTIPAINANRGGIARPVNGMVLPIPRKINEAQVLSWGEDSAINATVSIAGALPGVRTAANILQGPVGNIAGALAGATLNPYLFMYFQRPNYKEFSFNWTFSPRNRRESETLANIINDFKANSLPQFDPVFMSYPNIALIKMHPGDLLGNLKFKPCAIQSVIVDYTGAGPSFFKAENGSSSGAPTVVNLTVNFKEIQLWDRREITR